MRNFYDLLHVAVEGGGKNLRLDILVQNEFPVRFWPRDDGRVQDEPSTLLDGTGADCFDEVDWEADVEGEHVAHGGGDHARTEHVEENPVRVDAWGETVHEQGTEKFGVVIFLEGEEVFRVVHVAQDAFAGPDGGFLRQGRPVVGAAANPGNARGGAGLTGACFEMRQQFEGEEGVGEVIDLHVPLMSAGAPFELQDPDAGVEHQKVHDGQLRLHGLGKGLDALVIIHVQLHHLDDAVGVVGLDGMVGQQALSACLAFVDIADRKHDGGGIER